VLLNIAVNARDAMTSGGRITFQSRMGFHDEKAAGSIPGLGPGEYVAIVISDNGPGMSGEVMERVFEPFFTTKSAGEGTGLGLSVAYGIIKNHRGHVTISSTPGVGTSVSIYLPAILDRAEDPGPPDPGPPDAAPRVATAQDAESVDAGPPPAEEMVEAEPVASAPFTIETTRGEVFTGPERADPVPAAGPLDPGDAGKVAGSGRVDAASGEPAVSGACVLVVDDEEVVRTMAAEILQGGGYRVLTAKDGVEALEMYRSHWGQIAVVLLDMVMPRLGGLETFRRMLGMDRKARVLLYSGFGDSDKAQLAIREGAVGILAKPFGMNELLSWVARALERQR
jgi:two-component system cell cycle sensor histidine kinase/response regulator CckA